MTRGVDGFGPKLVWRLVLIKHCPCHLNKSPILPLCNTILLRSIGRGILMLDPLITQELIHCVILELGTVVTSNSHNLTLVLTLSFFGKRYKGLLSLIFGLEKENPCISCIVVDNDKAIPPPTQTIIGWRPKEIQMKELKMPRRCDDSLHLVLLLMLLSGNASTTNTILPLLLSPKEMSEDDLSKSTKSTSISLPPVI